MSSLLDHLDNNCSDRDEDDHINRLFPKCKPRASSLQPFATTAHDEECSIDCSKGSLSDCNLTNSNHNNINHNNTTKSVTKNNTVNNNNLSLRSQQQTETGRRGVVVENRESQQVSSSTSIHVVFNNDHQPEYENDEEYDNENDISSSNNDNFSFRCLNGPTLNKTVSCENSNSNNLSSRLPVNNPPSSTFNSTSSSKLKGKSGDSRHSRNRRRQHHHHHQQHHHHHHHNNTNNTTEGKKSVQLLNSGTSPSSTPASNQAKRHSSSSTSKTTNSTTTTTASSHNNHRHRSRIMECDTLDDHFDNGIESGGSGGSGGSNGSAFSHCSSLGSSGEKNNALSMSSSGLGSSGGNLGLRDSRIEIAGGREIFSHSRIKVGRRVRGSSSMDSIGMESSSGLTSMTGGLTPSSSQSQLQAKVRRKSTNNSNNSISTTTTITTTANMSNPQITHSSSPISPNSCSSIWEPHHIASSNKKSFPFSSSSSSSSRGDRNFVEDIVSPGSQQNSKGGGLSRHSHSHAHSGHGHGHGSNQNQSQTQSGVHCSYLRSSRSSHSGPHSQYYGRHGGGGGYLDGKKNSMSLDGFDVGCGGGVGGGGGMMGNNKSVMPQVHSPSSAVTSPSSGSSTLSGGLMMKETVFASEITSIEKPVERGEKEAKQPFIYQTPIDGGGEIVFDDIEDHWRNSRGSVGGGSGGSGESDDKEVTFVSMGPGDKSSQLNFLETLMRDNEEEEHQRQLQRQLQQQHPTVEHHEVSSVSVHGMGLGLGLGSSPSNPSGYESDECASSSIPANSHHYPNANPHANSNSNSNPNPNVNNTKTSPNNGNKRLIGNIPIAEYEGSPKRYGLRLPTQAKPNHLELVDPNSPSIAHSHLNVSTRGLSPRLQSPSSSTSTTTSTSFTGTRVPGFPLRVDTTPTAVAASVKSLVNEDFSSDNTCINSMLQEEHKLESDGQLNSKLDGVMSPTTTITTSSGSLAVLSSVSTLTSSALNSMGTTGGGITGTIAPATTTSGGGGGVGTTDTSPDDSVVSQQGSNNTTTNSSEDAEIELSSHRTDLTEDREDYLLYEFSETRKVLDEFFKPSPPTGTGTGGGGSGVGSGSGGGGGGGEGDERLGGGSNFDELDYTLRRQTGNSYVGQRLAGESCSNEQVEESPKKPPRRGVLLNVSSGGGASPRLISFQEVSLPLSHHSHLQSSISPSVSSSMMTPSAAMLLDSSRDVNDNDIDVETASTNTETDLGDTEVGLQVGHSRNFTLSPETTDCDSNELESEISLDYEASLHSSSRIGATMPVLEDGLSSGNVSDNEEPDDDETNLDLKRSALSSSTRKSTNLKNIPAATVSSSHVTTVSEPNPTLLLMKKQISEIEKEIKLRSSQKVQHSDTNGSGGGGANGTGSPSSGLPDSSPGTVNPQSSSNSNTNTGKHFIGSNNADDNFGLRDPRPESSIFDCNDPELEALDPMRPTPPPSPAPSSVPHHLPHSLHHLTNNSQQSSHSQILPGRVVSFSSCSNEGMNICSNNSTANPTTLTTSTSNSLSSHPNTTSNGSVTTSSTAGVAGSSSLGPLSDSSNVLLSSESSSSGGISSTGDIQNMKDAVTLPKNLSSQRSPFENSTSPSTSSGLTSVTTTNSIIGSSSSQPPPQSSSSEERLMPLVRDSSPVWVPRHPVSTGGNHHPHRSVNAGVRDPLLRKQRYEETPDDDADTDQETDRLLGQNRTEDDYGFYDDKEKDGVKKKRSKEDLMNNPSVLIEGVLFRARYLGSTQLVCEGQPTKATRMMQAEEAVSRIKAQANQNGSVCQLSSPSSSSSPPSIETTKGLKVLSPYRVKSGGEDEDGNGGDGGGGGCGGGDDGGNGDGDCVYPSGEGAGLGPGPGLGIRGESGGREEEDDDDEGESDEDSCEESDYYRQQRNPVAAVLDGSCPILDNTNTSTTIMTLDDEICSSGGGGGGGGGSSGGGISFGIGLGGGGGIGVVGRCLSTSELTSGVPPFGSMTGLGSGTNHGSGSLPHLSPPCGSALPGTMFRLRFVGSLEVEEEIGSGRRRRKRPKKTMVEEAVLKLKAPEGETQPSTEVDLFISTEKIMVLNTDLKEIMMDHALRTISYIADIGDLVVLMARRRPVPTDTVDESKIPRPPKMICHVFESDEAQYIAQSIGQAFQVAYMEFLKANGIEDHSFVREMDYQEVLNSQEIFGDELQMFAKKELQKEVVVPKTKGEILGVVIVESGWGSMLPTVVIANLAPAGAAARCGQLNIGDQIIAINGVSLVGLPLSTCQNYIKNAKTQTVVKLTVVPCPPVVEVKIKRPDTKYQLGFSVQNGVICSLLRGGIAERGGVRVGHRIIEINNQSVVAVPHEKIVNLLATSVGEINMKTMPTSMFRLLTGQETPLYI